MYAYNITLQQLLVPISIEIELQISNLLDTKQNKTNDYVKTHFN
jgi:hypothetical protein